MAVYATKALDVAAGSTKVLDALYNHLSNASAATHWTVKDNDIAAGGTAVAGDYFVVESKHATIQMQLRFEASAGDAILTVTAGWKNGWTGADGDDAGWGDAKNSGEKSVLTVSENTTVWILTDVGKLVLLVDKGRSGTVDACCIAGYYTGFESTAVDTWPTFLMAGYPNTSHADSILDGDHAWALKHDGDATVDIKGAATYSWAVATSRFTGLAIPVPIILDVATAGSECIRGTTDLIQFIPDRADKDTLGSRSLIVFNNLAFPWDGSVPA